MPSFHADKHVLIAAVFTGLDRPISINQGNKVGTGLDLSGIFYQRLVRTGAVVRAGQTLFNASEGMTTVHALTKMVEMNGIRIENLNGIRSGIANSAQPKREFRSRPLALQIVAGSLEVAPSLSSTTYKRTAGNQEE